MVVCGDRYRPLGVDVLISLLSLGLINISEPDENVRRNAVNNSITATPPPEKPLSPTRTRLLHPTQTSANTITLPWISTPDIDPLSKVNPTLKALSCSQTISLTTQTTLRTP